MNTEKRLTVWNLSDAEDTSSNDINKVNDVKAKMIKIIDIAKSGNGLENL